MDLQTKLANDGLALAHQSAATGILLDWGKWGDHVFAFNQEPATIVISSMAFADIEELQTRQELISTLQDHPKLFGDGWEHMTFAAVVGCTCSLHRMPAPRRPWRLAEVMGHLYIQLYCCPGAMIDDVISGKIAVADNVLGSYVEVRSDV